MINVQTYNLNNISLSHEVLETKITSFWNDIFVNQQENHLMILCKVKFSNSDQGWRTLGHLIEANYSDKELLLNYLTERLSILNDSYVTHPISLISFSYVIKSGKCENLDRILLDTPSENIKFHNFNNMNLAISMDPFSYGEIIVSKTIEEEGVIFERFIATNNTTNKTFRIDVYNEGKVNKVTILGSINLSWTDTAIDMETSNYFKREIKKSTIYFFDGEVILRKKELPAKAFRRLSKNTKLTQEFLTMDIETTTINNKITPYLINAYNGRHHLNSYNNNEVELFKEFFERLLSEVGSQTIIYAHNLSTFDGVLILKHLLTLGKVEPLLFNGKLISIKLKVSGAISKTIVFKDSMLLLPYSLRKLCQSFKIEESKGYFPFNLDNIFYMGTFPQREHWIGISAEKWLELKTDHGKKLWSFKTEAIKYCRLDCVSLHQVITQFAQLIYERFQVDAHKALTLPALAMKIYKTNFIPENTIYQLLGIPEYNIRQSYSGGAVDVYIPSNKISGPVAINSDKSRFRRLYFYDVNALYPTVMANLEMPIGKPIAFEGNIRKINPDAFGFFYFK
jgi:hypothetical protein